MTRRTARRWCWTAPPRRRKERRDEGPHLRGAAAHAAGGLRQRGRPHRGDVVLHRVAPFGAGAVPSSTTVSPFVVSSATSRAAAYATSSGSISRRPGFISASAFTASANDLPVFATMLRAPLQTISVAAKPGQSAFTVTPLPETSAASARVKPTSACLEAV